MADSKYGNLPEDVVNERGVSDATFQDFIAPMLAGLGVGKVLFSGGPAIVEGLTPTVGRTLAAAGAAGEEAVANRVPIITTVADILNKFQDKAQEIGDFARVFKYKALKAALEQSQLSPDEVLNAIQRIHADTNPIAQGLH